VISVTYGGPNGDAFALESAVAGVMKDATVQGYEMVLRSVLSVGAASRSLASGAAFEKSTKHLVANMLRSFTRRLEVQLLHGQRGLGIVDGAVVGDEVIEITDKSWAPGIWAGGETMLIDVYQADLTTLRVANLEIASVDFEARSITMTSGADGVVLDTDVLFYKGANGNEFPGIDQIVRNTGTLFGISAASYNLWKGNVIDAADAAISFTLIAKTVTRLVEKGLTDQDLVCLVNPAQFDVLIAEQDAKRMYDSSYSADKSKSGSKEIEFHSQNGMIKIVPSIYCKIGDAHIICAEEFMRVGSADVTFEQPGFEGEFFRLLNDANGYELRAYTDQALFCSAPGRNGVLTNLEVPTP